MFSLALEAATAFKEDREARSCFLNYSILYLPVMSKGDVAKFKKLLELVQQRAVAFEPGVERNNFLRYGVNTLFSRANYNFEIFAQGIVAHNTYTAGEKGSSSSLEEANIPKLADDDLERILRQDELSEADIETLFTQIPIFLVKKYHLVKSFKFDPIIDGIKAKLREQLGADIYEKRLMEVVMNSKKILYTNKAKEIFKERMELLKKVLALSKTNLVTIKEIEHGNKGKRTIQSIDGHALPTKFLQIIALTIYDIMRENFKNKIEGMELFGSVAKEKARFGSDIDGRLYLKERVSKDSEIEYVKSTIVWFIREIIKEENFSGEHIKILGGESIYSLNKVEAREDVEYYRESLEKIREILKDRRIVSSSLTAGDQELGGIDLTALPIITQSHLNQSLTVNMPVVSSALNLNINLDNELKQIQDMLKAGIMPASERIKEYALASSSLKPEDYSREIGRLLGCIADIFRLEEEKAKPTPQALKDALILLESDSSA